MTGLECPILGKEKAAPARAAQSEDSVIRQNPRFYSRTPDPRLNSRQRERLVRKAERSTTRVRGTGFGRRPFRVVPMDGYILAFGAVPIDVHEVLSRTHVEYGASATGGIAWFPKEVPDAA
jgi:hypothetical protein